MATKYLVGKPFKIGDDRTLQPGDLAPKEIVVSRALDSLVSAGFLYPYVPERGYANLPPHIFNAVRTRQEALGIIERGQAPMPVVEWEEPAKVTQAIELIEAEKRSHAENAAAQETRARKQHEEFEKTQLSPRPVELPKEKMFVDSKHDEAAKAAEDAPQTDYSKKTKAELVSEIEHRNEGRDVESQINPDGNKSDLVQRLYDDDLAVGPEKTHMGELDASGDYENEPGETHYPTDEDQDDDEPTPADPTPDYDDKDHEEDESVLK